jgi:HSP20 family protein
MLWSDLERLMNFDPWREFERFNRTLPRPAAPSTVEFPALNVWVGADRALVTTELPGVDKEAIDVSVSGNVLTLKGSRNPEELKEDESYHRRERWYGEFSKTLDLPFDIEVQKVEAKFSKGILTVTLPRAEAEKPRKISIA